MDFDYNGMSQVYPGIFITNWESSMDFGLLKRNKIKAIIGLTHSEKPDSIKKFYRDNGIEYVHIYIEDMPSEPISKYFDESVEFIGRNLNDGKNVLVHCMAGISRSATIVLAYLTAIKDNGTVNPETLINDTIREVTRYRPINPNPGFLEQLYNYILNNRNTASKKDTNPTQLSIKDFDMYGNLLDSFIDKSVVLFAENYSPIIKPFTHFSDNIRDPELKTYIVIINKNSTNHNPKLMSWRYDISALPLVVGYYKGKFFSECEMEYSDTENDVIHELIEYSAGIGSAKVEYRY